MKCPKCNYTSFDYNQVCPKCGKDNSDEQVLLKFSPNKPNPPFFLASLIGVGGAETSEAAGIGGGAHVSNGAFGEMDGNDLLIALDKLDGDDTRPDDTPEILDPSKEEIVFETDDLEPLKPLETTEPAEDEILFDLETASEEIEIESVDRDPLDLDLITDSPDETQVPIEVAEIEVQKPAAQPTEAAAADDVGLFLADEPESAENPDSSELFLSLDDLSDNEPKQTPTESNAVMEDEILFELEEEPEANGVSSEKEIKDEKDFWNSDKVNKKTVGSEPEKSERRKTDPPKKESTDSEDEVNLFSDLDVEPLDLDLSLEDLEKKPE